MKKIDICFVSVGDAASGKNALVDIVKKIKKAFSEKGMELSYTEIEYSEECRSKIRDGSLPVILLSENISSENIFKINELIKSFDAYSESYPLVYLGELSNPQLRDEVSELYLPSKVFSDPDYLRIEFISRLEQLSCETEEDDSAFCGIFGNVFLELGMCFRDSGRLDSAELSYQMAESDAIIIKDVDPMLSRYLMYQSSKNLGIIYLKDGRNKEAREKLSVALDMLMSLAGKRGAETIKELELLKTLLFGLTE